MQPDKEYVSNALRFTHGEMIGMRSAQQVERDREYYELARELMARFGENWPAHCLSILKRNSLSRIIYLNDIYRQILDVPGVICNFGVHWGGSLSTFVNLRALYEPWNSARTVHGFDTFAGFAGVTDKDGGKARDGDYASMEGYEEILDKVLAYHESISPLSEYRKYEIVKGDVCATIGPWLEHNPHAVIALAFFDLDLHKPTRQVLDAIKPRLTKGSVLVFDELTCPSFPGEAIAVAEVLGLNNVRMRRHPFEKYAAIVTYE